ncbi:hypothetical protein [Halorubrum sp. Eb13]|uniref:hypothetical protein n=1 Tax=Halorubrum sp. Eb13 TaxID=1383843 RepID=UPI000B9968B2|nr:hypothetical protein [Halorubrum sp. Eb13]
MANRRKFIAGLGALATGSAAAIGTGATSQIRAERSVTASVTGDGSAYLGLEERSEYATYSDGELTLQFPTLNENANTRFENVFWIRNNGNQDLSVQAYTLDDSGNFAGWTSSDFALYWSQNETSGPGAFPLPYEALHEVNNVSDPSGNGPSKEIPRLSPGEAIAVHPMLFLKGDEDAGDAPSTIDFYATHTPL